MAESDFEKTEAPTPRRLQEAREEGNVTRSTDLTAASVLLAGMLLLYVLGQRLLESLVTTVRSMLSGSLAENPTTIGELAAMPTFIARVLAESLGPFVGGIFVVAMLATIGQVGFLFTTKPLEPKLSRLSPLRGARNLVNMRAGIRLLMSVAKVFVIGAVAGVLIYIDVDRIMLLPHLELSPMFASASGLIFGLGLKLALLLMVLALIDYAFQRWQRERDLRMTPVEIKDELKRMEGDPLVKHRRARVARQLALQRIGQDVPKADVVVTNPTHYAVAFRYDSTAMKAPKVVAKGADCLAMRIRQVAIAYGVPMVERKDLAAALYNTVEIGQEVPAQFYSTVAEILAYVYRLSGRKTA